MNDIARIVPTKSDAERAREIKEDIIEKLKPVLESLTQAHSEGFKVNFHLGPNSFNQVILQTLIVSREF